MIIATLDRYRTDDEGTFGRLVLPGLTLETVELPWRDNTPKVSCIPQGTYQVRPRFSNRFGRHFHVTKVIARTMILIHAGNLAGDKHRGWATHSEGCILPGRRTGKMVLDPKKGRVQRAVFQSRPALSMLRAAVRDQPFMLQIVGVCG